MRWACIAIGIPLIAGCAVSKQTFGPDGRTASSINCSGLALAWGACYEKAGAICGTRGYDVLAVNGDSGAVVTANPQGAFGGSVITRTMVISCKGAGAGEQGAAATGAAKRYVSGAMPGSADCPVRVISAGGKPLPPEEQCLPAPPPGATP